MRKSSKNTVAVTFLKDKNNFFYTAEGSETTECEEGSTEEDQNILIDTESGCAADADSSCDSDTLAMFPPALADKTVGLSNSARSQSIGTPLQASYPSSDDIAGGETDSDIIII
eukprot:TRINITY_DN4657_c0_g1_i4.p1 TRINITY_DN4657_c0_g1~~TRINITY_DN4657_c0_g1_i4.p1  ORF type:complete len:114 (-),score=17.10 TRINITY_DN4657_c0_g1_i4:45-386(-)